MDMKRIAIGTIVGGIAAGAVIGFLAWFHADFSTYAYSNMWRIVIPIVDPLLEIVHEGIAGAVIAAVLMRIPAGATLQPAR